MFKFIATGVLNTAIDFAVLNILIKLFGVSSTHIYVLWKTISFFCALTNSYFMNKYWVFRHVETGSGMKSTLKEGSVFLLVSAGGLLINITLASVTVFLLSRIAEPSVLSSLVVANVGAFVGTVAVLFWNFFGYKHVVFKEKGQIV